MDETAATFPLWLCNNGESAHFFFFLISYSGEWKKNPTITLRGVSVCMCEEFQCHRSHIIICFGSQNRRRGRAWMRERLIRAGVDSRCPHCCLDQAKHIYIIAHKLLGKQKCGMCDAASPPPERGNKHFAPRLCGERQTAAMEQQWNQRGRK